MVKKVFTVHSFDLLQLKGVLRSKMSVNNGVETPDSTNNADSVSAIASFLEV